MRRKRGKRKKERARLQICQVPGTRRVFSSFGVFLLVLADFLANPNTSYATFEDCESSSCSKSASPKISNFF